MGFRTIATRLALIVKASFRSPACPAQSQIRHGIPKVLPGIGLKNTHRPRGNMHKLTNRGCLGQTVNMFQHQVAVSR